MKLAESPRLALLDRDGTLIDVVRDAETGTITTAFHPNQIRVLDGVVDGLRALVDAGYLLAIVTNQPGPAKGHFGRDAVERTNAALVSTLAARAFPSQESTRACTIPTAEKAETHAHRALRVSKAQAGHVARDHAGARRPARTDLDDW